MIRCVVTAWVVMSLPLGCRSDDHLDRALSGRAPDAAQTFSASPRQVADTLASVLGTEDTFIVVNDRGAAEIAWGPNRRVFADDGGIGLAIPLGNGRTRLELTGFSAAGGAERVMLSIQRRIE